RLWETATAKPAGEPIHYLGEFVAFLSGGETILTGRGTKLLRLWDRTGKAVQPEFPHAEPVLQVEASPDGSKHVTMTEKTIQVWERTTGKIIGKPLAKIRLGDVHFLDKRVLNVEFYERSDMAHFRVWDLLRGTQIDFQLGGDPNGVAFTPTGQTVFVYRNGPGVQMGRQCELATGALGPVLQYDGPFLTFTPNGKHIITGGDDFPLQVRDPATGKRVGKPWQPGFPPGEASFSADG